MLSVLVLLVQLPELSVLCFFSRVGSKWTSPTRPPSLSLFPCLSVGLSVSLRFERGNQKQKGRQRDHALGTTKTFYHTLLVNPGGFFPIIILSRWRADTSPVLMHSRSCSMKVKLNAAAGWAPPLSAKCMKLGAFKWNNFNHWQTTQPGKDYIVFFISNLKAGHRGCFHWQIAGFTLDITLWKAIITKVPCNSFVPNCSLWY